jgi:hypothetical protein
VARGLRHCEIYHLGEDERGRHRTTQSASKKHEDKADDRGVLRVRKQYCTETVQMQYSSHVRCMRNPLCAIGMCV